jgi:hypothetical protein
VRLDGYILSVDRLAIAAQQQHGQGHNLVARQGLYLIFLHCIHYNTSEMIRNKGQNWKDELASWGQPGAPLLPRSLVTLWGSDPLPSWVLQETKLPEASTIAALAHEIWAHGLTQISPRLRGYAINLVTGRRDQIDSVRVLSSGWPESLAPWDLPLEKRTKNCLERVGLMHSPDVLANVTFGQLFSIGGMGVVSILDFASTAEAAIEQLGNREPIANSSLDAAAGDSLLELIEEPWARQISDQDPRFADLLPNGRGTLYERIDSLTEKPLEGDRALLELSEAVPALRRRIQEIEVLPLDIALREFLYALTGISDKRFDALLARFGWGGNESATLEDAGAMAGVTRERIRQLQQRVLKRLPDHPVFMPSLDRGLDALQQSVPLDRMQAALLLQKQGISSQAFDPISLLETAAIFKRTLKLQHEIYRGHMRIVVTTAVPRSADSLINIAHRQAGASGASNVQEVVAEATAHGIQTSEPEVFALLQEFSDLEFLDTEWFWHPSGSAARNRLRNATRKMLAVASPLGIATVREGLRREYRWRTRKGGRNWPLVVPHKSVLRAFYRANAEFRIDEQDNLRPAAPLDYRDELGECELILVDALRSFPTCVLDRASYLTACSERGMNENTFSVYLTYSAIVAHLGTDIWSLRGIQLDPAAVEAVREVNAASPRERRVLDQGWTEDGWLWVAVRLPPQSAGFVFGIPAAVKRYLAAREFEATSDEGAPCGKIKVRDDGMSWGYGPFLNRSGADEGDILIVTFSLTENRAILRLGDDEVLDEISPEF